MKHIMIQLNIILNIVGSTEVSNLMQQRGF